MSKRSFMGGFGRSGSRRGGNPFSKGKKQTEKQDISIEERAIPETGLPEPKIPPKQETQPSLEESFFNFEEAPERNLGQENSPSNDDFEQIASEEQFDFFNQDITEEVEDSAQFGDGDSEVSLTEQFLNVGEEAAPSDDFGWGETRERGTLNSETDGGYGESVSPVSQRVNEEARVFLRYSEEAPKGNPFLAALISLFRLDVYGKNKLSKRALYAMEMASVIMVVIFCFDLSLWFVLFNLILNKGGEAFAIGVLTPFAILLALCMATVSIIFEASIFTADLSKMDFKKWLALGSRIGLVLIAARITAAPFHVLIFHGPIAERTRIEQGIEKGVFIAGELQDSKSNLEKAICSNEGQAGVVKEDREEVAE